MKTEIALVRTFVTVTLVGLVSTAISVLDFLGASMDTVTAASSAYARKVGKE